MGDNDTMNTTSSGSPNSIVLLLWYVITNNSLLLVILPVYFLSVASITCVPPKSLVLSTPSCQRTPCASFATTEACPTLS